MLSLQDAHHVLGCGGGCGGCGGGGGSSSSSSSRRHRMTVGKIDIGANRL